MKTSIIKTSIVVALVMLSAGANATAFPERACLSMGSIANSTTYLRDMGETEDMQLAKPTQANIKVTVDSIINFVYTMGFDAKTNRRMVYLKCKAGDYTMR